MKDKTKKEKTIKTKAEKTVSKPNLPQAPLERIARNAGAERISAGAVEELRDAVEEMGADLARDIVKVSKHAGRRTIKPQDIRVVVE